MEHIIVVGGGASGLTAAITAARNGHKVTVLEHKDKIGKKIYATGNGRCNFTNLVQEPGCYRSNNSTFPEQVLTHFGVSQTLEFFRELGIYPKVKNGYVYPYSEQAASVAEVLRLELERLKVTVECGVHAERIEKNAERFLVVADKGRYRGDRVILSAGGCALSQLGSDGSGFWIAEQLGHTIIPPLPALVQLRSPGNHFKTLAGVRTDAYLRLYLNDEYAAEEKGELLFTEYGVSGIPVLQLSRFASKALYEKKKVDLMIDLLPEIDGPAAMAMLRSRMEGQKEKTAEESFIGLFHHKLTYICLKEAGVDPTVPCINVNKKQIRRILDQIKQWNINITGTNSFEQAQVTAGGIDTREINPHTMESRLIKGLYLTGELMDVDGTCGGYNLQWAWSTGVVAGNLKHEGAKNSDTNLAIKVENRSYERRD